MTDRPIIFSAPMVQALLAGRKTMTRRILKLAGRLPDYVGPSGCTDDPACWGWEDSDHGDYVTIERESGSRMGWRDWVGAYCAGDRLYVREAFQGHTFYEAHGYKPSNWGNKPIWYCADGDPDPLYSSSSRRRPSIHMPRWASRLTLTVTEVRVQRLHEISEADAVAEGIMQVEQGLFDYHEHAEIRFKTAKSAFQDLWNSLHGPDAWEANPWVVALTFTVAKGNIDA